MRWSDEQFKEYQAKRRGGDRRQKVVEMLIATAPKAETVLTFTLPYPPSANRYWRNVNGRMVVSADARAYKEGVGRLIGPKVKEPLSGDVYVRVRIFRPRKSGDLDNTLKVLLDSIKGIVFHDDEQVVEIRANRFDDKANPRAEVTVERRVTFNG